MPSVSVESRQTPDTIPNHNKMNKLFTFVLAVIIVTSGFAQKTELHLNLDNGKTYYQISETRSKVLQNINGQNIDMDMTVSGSTSYLVREVKSDVYEIEVMYKNLKMTIAVPQGTMSFDSDKKDQDMVSGMLAEMINKPFQISLTKRGVVTSVRNIDQLFASALNKFPELPEAQRAQMKSQLAQAYGPKALKGNIEMITAIYPEKAVATGDDWEVKTLLESSLSLDITTKYKLAESNADYHLIKGQSKLVSNNAIDETNGMRMKSELAGTMVSEIKVDKTSGWIVHAKISQEVEGDVYTSNGQPGGETIKVPMSIKNDMIFTDH